MGVRPPTNGGDDEPESIEFGIAAVDARLKQTDIEFPATEADVREALGTTAIPYDVKGNSIALGKALEAVDVETFESRQELLNALHPVFEHYREERSGGLLGRVRSLFGR